MIVISSIQNVMAFEISKSRQITGCTGNNIFASSRLENHPVKLCCDTDCNMCYENHCAQHQVCVTLSGSSIFLTFLTIPSTALFNGILNVNTGVDGVLTHYPELLIRPPKV